MSRPIIYITRKIPSSIIKPYEDRFHFRMWTEDDTPVPKDILWKECKHADGMISMLTENLNREFLRSHPHIQIIANNAVGYDNIDIDIARKQQTVVTNTPDVLTETTADLTFALLMVTARRIIEAHQVIENDEWKQWSPYFLAGTDVYDQTIGIVGMGRIGEAVARRAKGFNMKILYHNRFRNEAKEEVLQAEYTEFNELLQRADFVVSLVHLTAETFHLFDAEAFQKMKRSAIFINASRGQVVDEHALYNALKDKQIHAAGLDVFAEEPIRRNHPLRTLKNAVCLPHIGSASMQTRTNMLKLCVENIDGYFYGDGPKTAVTPLR